MATVKLQVNIHEENGCWWAESGSLPGWSAAADSREELITIIKTVPLEGSFIFIGPWVTTPD